MSQTPAINEIVLILSNDPLPKIGKTFEHLHPDDEPQWRFAAIADAASFPADTVTKTSPEQTTLYATRHGPKAGADATGSVVFWIVLTNAVEGKDAEFNDWYDNQHLHDVVAVPGLVCAQRYKITGTPDGNAAPWAYLAIYEVELENAAKIIADVRARAGGPKMPNPGYLAPGPTTLPFRPLA